MTSSKPLSKPSLLGEASTGSQAGTQSQEILSQNDLSDACCICLDPVTKSGRRYALLEKCDHRYCEQCARTLMEYRHDSDEDFLGCLGIQCPTCRTRSAHMMMSDVHLANESEQKKTLFNSIICCHDGHEDMFDYFSDDEELIPEDSDSDGSILSVSEENVSGSPASQISDFFRWPSQHRSVSSPSITSTIHMPERNSQSDSEQDFRDFGRIGSVGDNSSQENGGSHPDSPIPKLHNILHLSPSSSVSSVSSSNTINLTDHSSQSDSDTRDFNNFSGRIGSVNEDSSSEEEEEDDCIVIDDQSTVSAKNESEDDEMITDFQSDFNLDTSDDSFCYDNDDGSSFWTSTCGTGDSSSSSSDWSD